MLLYPSPHEGNASTCWRPIRESGCTTACLPSRVTSSKIIDELPQMLASAYEMELFDEQGPHARHSRSQAESKPKRLSHGLPDDQAWALSSRPSQVRTDVENVRLAWDRVNLKAESERPMRRVHGRAKISYCSRSRSAKMNFIDKIGMTDGIALISTSPVSSFVEIGVFQRSIYTHILLKETSSPLPWCSIKDRLGSQALSKQTRKARKYLGRRMVWFLPTYGHTVLRRFEPTRGPRSKLTSAYIQMS